MSQSESPEAAAPPPAAPARPDAFAALRYPEFRRLMAGAFLFTVGIQIQEVVIGYELYTMTHRPIVLGLIGIAEAIPFISLALFGGLLADRRDKRKLILGSVSFVAAGSLILLWALLPATRAWMSQNSLLGTIYGVIAAFGLARGLFAPAASSLSAFLVPRALYPNSSAWRSTAWQAGAILGPGSAGFLYAAFGLTATLALVVALFIAAVVLFSGIRAQPPTPIAAGTTQPKLWQSLREGIDFVLGNRIILYALSLDMFSVLFGGVVAILPVFSTDILHVGPQGLGILRAAPAVGAMLTLLACTRYPPTQHAWRNLLIAVGGFGVMTLTFGLSRIFWLSAAALFVSGAFDSISVVIRNTILQMLPPDHLRGARAFGQQHFHQFVERARRVPGGCLGLDLRCYAFGADRRQHHPADRRLCLAAFERPVQNSSRLITREHSIRRFFRRTDKLATESIAATHDNGVVPAAATRTFDPMQQQAGKPGTIRWPEHYDPAQSPVFVRNQLQIAAPPETVWAWLVRAPAWPQWYSNSRNLKIVRGSPSELAPGSRFVWTTFGVRLTSEVKEFVSGERLAWDAKAMGVDAYHAWLLTPTTDGGCLVLTEETQHGFVARVGALLFPKRMSHYHQIWLESLNACALSGLPPA